MQRVVEPEWLDQMPSEAAGAVRSRADIRRLNALLGHAGAVARVCRRLAPVRASGRIVELGAGDGTYLLAVARRVRRWWPNAHAVLVDRCEVVEPQTRDAFQALGWTVETVRADVFDWLESSGSDQADVMVANLFLHHFESSEVRRLLGLAAPRTRSFVGCEPRRSWLALWGSRCVGLVGCGAVTRHDAVVSVRAGFTGDELSACWPSDSNWDLVESRSGWLSHLFVARRATAATEKLGVALS